MRTKLFVALFLTFSILIVAQTQEKKTVVKETIVDSTKKNLENTQEKKTVVKETIETTETIVDSTKKNVEKTIKKKITVETKTEKVIWNKLCPIMGEEIDPEVETVEYKDKTIGFCCKPCIRRFNKDPEKHLKSLSDDGQTLR